MSNEQKDITPVTVATAGMQDSNDERALRHGREVHVGFKVGQYLQPPPFFFTRDKWPAPLVDMYRGASAFLIAGGPSFGLVDHEKLRAPGVLTMGLNNSVKSFRPNLWLCVDDPANFIRSTWLDPKITKFAPISHIDKPIFNSDEWKFMDQKVGDCPNVWYYKRNERFKADQYLTEDTINWGNHTNMGGGRSCMLAAVRILYMLGVRRIFLLGVDFNMTEGSKYHFEQDRASGSIKGNNGTYKLLQERFTQLRPVFEKNGLYVFNCNPDSKLTAFDHMPFEEAITLARGLVPENTAAERTAGLYERKANEGKGQKPAPNVNRTLRNPPSNGTQKSCANCSRKDIGRIREQVDSARSALHAAKAITAEMMRKEEEGHADFDAGMLLQLREDEDRKRKVYRNLLAIRKDVLGQ